MNILLVESHYRSRSWFKAIKGLGNLSIISVMPEEKRLFVAQGVANADILDLHNPDLEKVDYLRASKELSKMESIYGFKANEIVLMDRTLRIKDHRYITKYIYHIASAIESFIKQKNIQVVFIEPTWSHEVLICIVCHYFGIPVWAPVKSKLIPDSFFFFSGYKNEICFQRKVGQDESQMAEKAFSFIRPDNKPQYFSKFNKRSKVTLPKFRVLYDITKLALLKDKNINIQPPWRHAVMKKLLAILRAPYLKKTAGFVTLNEIERPYILVTLHLQPEASIDVVGNRFDDQLNFVRNIVRTTPTGFLVVVKEHPHAFGDRNSDFYSTLRAMPHVVILDPFEESRAAIKEAALVISNTGTSSLEAAMMGVPGVTATKMYFSELMVMPSFEPAVGNVTDLLEKAEAWKKCYSSEKIKKSLGSIKKNLFSGNVADFKTDPTVLSQENIEKLRAAFAEVIEAGVERVS